MKALVVDDDRVLADLVAFTLQREGFQVITAFNGAMALRSCRTEEPDLIVLDVNLPDSDGFTLCRQMRLETDSAIVMLTIRGDEDDYIQKPFSPRQLVARIQAVLRRAGKSPVPAIRRVGDLSLDAARREVRIASDTVVQLTRLETQLLDYLMLNAGHVLTSDAIINQVWGAQGADRAMLRQLIYRLRHKIERDPSQPTYIETVSGLGYSFLLPNS